jgi:hypothetical protein
MLDRPFASGSAPLENVMSSRKPCSFVVTSLAALLALLLFVGRGWGQQQGGGMNQGGNQQLDPGQLHRILRSLRQQLTFLQQ